MSYLVLARKWRPQGFGDLIGQEPISRILSNAIEQGRIAHAYLFSGPRGVGKTSTARILAKSLNCEKGPTPTPCGTCTFCRGVGEGSSMDVMEIDGASNNSVDDIRDLREKVKYAPSGGRYKVYIIDEAHMLSGPAFNALLKTLEEPPAHVIFVLATTAPRKIPATVLSRCQHLPFRKIPLLKIKQRLKMISDSEGITISDPAIEMIARESEGGMRDSLTILDQVSAFSSDIKEAEVKNLLGIADFRALSDLAGAVVKGDRRRILGIIDELTDLGTDLKSFAKDLMQFFRDLLVAKVVARPREILDLSENELAVMQDILNATSEDHLSLFLSEMIRAEAEVRFAFSPRVSLEMALIRASFLSVLKPIQEAIKNIESYGVGKEDPPAARDLPEHHPATRREEEKVVVRSLLTEVPSVDRLSLDEPEPSPLPATSSGAASKSASYQPEGKFRDIFLEKMESLNHLLAIKLSEAEIRIEDDALVVTFSGGSAIHADSVKKSLDLLSKSVEEIIGKKVVVKIETEKKKRLYRKELKENILSEPLIKEAIELFEGRIVEIRPMDNTRKGGKNV